MGTTSVQVTLDDTDKAQAILNSFTDSGISSTSGPEFGLSTAAQEALRQELEVAAVADAKEQAAALADEAGGKLGRLLSVGEGQVSSGGYSPVLSRGAVDSISAAEIAPTSDLESGENELQVTVNVTYQLK